MLLSLGFRRSQVVLFFFTQLWKMVRSSIVYRYLRLYRRVLTQRKFLYVDWTNWSYGILSVIILLLLLGVFLGAQSGKYIGKDKNGTTVNIYLLLTLHILRVIYLTLIIQKFRTNTSAHT